MGAFEDFGALKDLGAFEDFGALEDLGAFENLGALVDFKARLPKALSFSWAVAAKAKMARKATKKVINFMVVCMVSLCFVIESLRFYVAMIDRSFGR